MIMKIFPLNLLSLEQLPQLIKLSKCAVHISVVPLDYFQNNKCAHTYITWL